MFVVFDLETTGLNKINDDIIEFAYLMFDSNNLLVKAERMYFYHEGMTWSEEAYKVHQISKEFLKTQADKFTENLIKMYSVLKYATVVGHNARKFDCEFAQFWLSKFGLPLTFNKIIDTMTDMQSITKRPRIKLTKLIDYCDITPEAVATATKLFFGDADDYHAHEASYDATATALIALYGIRNNIISIEDPTETEVNLTMNELLSNDNEGLKTNPTKSIFALVNEKSSGTCTSIEQLPEPKITYYQLNPDKLQYSSRELRVDELEAARNEKYLFPLPLFKVFNNVYQNTYNGVVFKLDISNSTYDRFSCTTSYGEIDITNNDLGLLIKNNFKEA